MENRQSIFEKTTSTNRNLLALVVITLTIIGIIIISWTYIKSNSGQEGIVSENIFNALLPLFATWVGTVLAFYFGRENFEAASQRYEEIISRLTPEILDDIFVNQIMITRKTIVSITLEEAKKKSVQELVDFLDSVNKSRIPIFEGDSIKYIIHKSIFLDALNKDKQMSFDTFAEKHTSIITTFILIPQNEILENVLAQLKAKTDVRDVFVLDDDQKVIGWLTDTLIMRFIKT